MSRALVVGGTGFVGAALVAELHRRGRQVIATSRRPAPLPPGEVFYDLADGQPEQLPVADTVYLVAAMPTFAACEGNPLAWRVNVDAPIAIARQFPGAFVVFVSSDAVEWCGATAYARQKAQVEGFMHSRWGAIVRPNRILPQTVGAFAALLADVGESRNSGLHRWDAAKAQAKEIAA